MEDRRDSEGTGAYEWSPLVDETEEAPPEEFQNPPGIARGECDTDETDESCDLEMTAQVDDMFLEETKPGSGIAGFEGEEDGGG